MSRKRQFVISDSGYLYECTTHKGRCHCAPGGNGTRRLGHISQLLNDSGHLGKAIRKWWSAYLVSDVAGRENRSTSNASALFEEPGRRNSELFSVAPSWNGANQKLRLSEANDD
jgi:hypothetical protein